MSETTNYNLFVTDDNAMRFLDWREKINGTIDSNMVKIDNALSKKAELSKAINATLPMSGWTDGSAPYSQVLIISGLKASQNGIISVSQNITSQQMEVVCAAGLNISSQSDGTITIVANGDRPTMDIPVTIMFLG